MKISFAHYFSRFSTYDFGKALHTNRHFGNYIVSIELWDASKYQQFAMCNILPADHFLQLPLTSYNRVRSCFGISPLSSRQSVVQKLHIPIQKKELCRNGRFSYHALIIFVHASSHPSARRPKMKNLVSLNQKIIQKQKTEKWTAICLCLILRNASNEQQKCAIDCKYASVFGHCVVLCLRPTMPKLW